MNAAVTILDDTVADDTAALTLSLHAVVSGVRDQHVFNLHPVAQADTDGTDTNHATVHDACAFTAGDAVTDASRRTGGG